MKRYSKYFESDYVPKAVQHAEQLRLRYANITTTNVYRLAFRDFLVTFTPHSNKCFTKICINWHTTNFPHLTTLRQLMDFDAWLESEVPDEED